jgi:hypothetical protein
VDTSCCDVTTLEFEQAFRGSLNALRIIASKRISKGLPKEGEENVKEVKGACSSNIARYTPNHTPDEGSRHAIFEPEYLDGSAVRQCELRSGEC